MSFLLAIMALISTALLQERLLYGLLARTSLLTFAQLTSPVPNDYLNPRVSKYVIKRHHAFIGHHLERVKRREINRLEIELPARHGKSLLAVRKFVPWISGDKPDESGIVVTHTDTLAREHGRAVRDVLRMGAYRLAFPDVRAALRDDTQASDLLQLNGGGVLMFSGRSGLGAGAGADWLIFDDFFKNSEEAQSETVRNSAWATFISDCQSRLNTDESPIILIGTRRHEDDVQGRLFDPTNEHYDEAEAKRWTRIRLPALAEDDDLLGREKDEALWPEKYGQRYYLARRNHKSEIVRLDHQTQDQCNPTPREGEYFKNNWLKTYEPGELPSRLRIYAASDHAYRKGQNNDRNCLLVVGIDPSGVLWVLPDTWWDKSDTLELVERMIGLMETKRPACWWAARDAISGSVGPFLNQRMKERKVFAWVNDEIREDKDLMRRAQSIRNHMAMGMVRFPSFWPQWGEAEKELLTFPNGKHDDLVAAMAMLGMGLDQMIKAEGDKPSDLPAKGTYAYHSYGQKKPNDDTKGWQ